MYEYVCITNCTDYKSQVLVGEVVNIEGLKVWSLMRYRAFDGPSSV